MVICKTFLNRPRSSYTPLACKQPVITMREMTKGGDANKQEFFFLTKPNTIRERATLDLIYPHPQWLVREIEGKDIVLVFERVTTGGETRVIDGGLIRVVN